MLLPTLSRFTVFPIKHENLWSLYKKAQMSNWTAEEIDFSKDMDDWNGLSDNEKKYIKSSTEKKQLFEAIQTIPCIERKAKWAMKWFDKKRPFAERLLAFACVEGIFFSGSFCAIYWLKKRGLLPGLCFSNELISRDEGMHQEFAVELFNMLKNKLSGAVIEEIIRDAVTIEKEFITDALPCSLIGMNSGKMSEYIEYVADRLSKQVGHDKIWNTKNPFDFMENISLDGKTNFFEKRVGDYGKMDEDTTNIEFDEEF